jgi:LysR family transcriptional regulator, transcriptional activator for leuABCD operon
VTVESEVPEINIKQPQTTDGIKPQLRTVDLNLLTVFDAVMQEQNITRAAHTLGMSQPAVSNAVARLKVMFNDELFVRYGRGIQPTARHSSYSALSVRRCSWFRTSCQGQALNL